MTYSEGNKLVLGGGVIINANTASENRFLVLIGNRGLFLCGLSQIDVTIAAGVLFQIILMIFFRLVKFFHRQNLCYDFLRKLS